MPVDNPYGITIGLNNKLPPTPNFQFWTNLLADMANLGTSWLRFQLDWKLIQLNQNDPPSAWAWGPLDDAVAHCNANGINICFPVRGEPSWALVNPAMRATNESGASSNSPNGDGWYLPDPTMFANFAQQVALRYNGVTINPGSGQPYGTLAAIEFGNELYNIHDTKPNVTPHWVGIYNSPYTGLYNGVNGVTQSNKVQPARDMYFLAQALRTGYPLVKAANPGILVVMGAMWWTQPANPGGVPNTPVSNYTACMQTLYAQGAKGCWDVTNVHVYTNQSNPAVTTHQVSSFAQMWQDVQAVHVANGEPNKPLWVTEFSWQQLIVNTTSTTSVTGGNTQATITVSDGSNIWPNMQLQVDSGNAGEVVKVTSVSGTSVTTTFANAHSGTYVVTSVGDVAISGGTDNSTSRLSYVLDSARTSGVVTKVFYFTLNYTQVVGSSLASLVQWGYNQSSPSSYVQMPVYTTLKNYIATYPFWTTTLPALVTLTDSVAQAISDYNATFVSNNSAAVQALASILSNVSGQGATQTLGRILQAPSSPVTRNIFLQAGSIATANLGSWVASIETLSSFTQQFYPLMDALEHDTNGFVAYLSSYATTLGLPAYGLVNAFFALCFNAYATQAASLGYRQGGIAAPQVIPNTLIFPSGAVDPLYSFTCGSGSTMTYGAQGTVTAAFGGGTAPFWLYKTSTGNAAGGATFQITYLDGSGDTLTSTYPTTISLAGSSTLATGSVPLGISGQAVLAVSGTGMTLGEQYNIGAKLVRPPAY